MNHAGNMLLLLWVLMLAPASGYADPLKASNYDVKFYFIDLEVNDTSTFIKGATTIVAEILPEGSGTLVLDMGSMLRVDSVLLDGHNAAYTHGNEELSIFSTSLFPGEDLVTIQVYYQGSGKGRRYFGGLHNARDMVWDKNVTWTLSEPYSAKHWFPCKQDLEDKADSVYVFITTDKELKAGSNGVLTAQTMLPDGRIRHEWKSRYPVAYYLISFAVSDYRDYSFHVPISGRDDSLLIQNYIYDSDVYFNNYRDDIDMTGDFITLFMELFGPYPFDSEKYGHCIVPSGGGMEHQTMTTLENFSFVLVSHELAHQWFGDLVTCSSWQDIWVNEGFASYAEYLAYQHLVSQEKADQWMQSARDIVMSRPAGSVRVPSGNLDDENRIFDYRLTYKKGAAIIHMIRQEINNDSLFFDILRDFLSRYGHGTASAEDFRTLLDERTSMNFKGFFDQWYAGEGYPVVRCQWQQDHDTLHIRAVQTTTSVTNLFNLSLDLLISTREKDSLVTRRLASDTATWKIPVSGRVTSVEVDPFKWLLGDFSVQQTEFTEPEPEDKSTGRDHRTGSAGVVTHRQPAWVGQMPAGNRSNFLSHRNVKE